MSNLVNVLKNGGVAVIPTDTIYGVVGQALNKETVERIYKIKKRNPEKPFIILISNFTQLNDFGVALDESKKEVLTEFWPGPVSIIFPAFRENNAYLHRGTSTLAFRMPENKALKDLIQKVGPLVAPSANPEGKEPAKNIQEAKNYFGNAVDCYKDGGEVYGKPSKIIDFTGLELVTIRD